MEAVRLKHAQVKPTRDILQARQKGVCPLCGGFMSPKASHKNPALDHDHVTGIIRDVLCLNCNGLEGKIWNLLRRMKKGGGREVLRNLLAYYERHDSQPHGRVLHPTHKTEAEKRTAANAKARKKRAALKG